MINILVPTDFSENARNALNYALELFKDQECTFYFMNAYQADVYNHNELISRVEFEDILDNIRHQSHTNLKRLLNEVKNEVPNPNFTYYTISSYNLLIEEIALLTHDKNIDLVVLGTRGKSNKGNVTFGSNTYQVLKYVHCPVLSIPFRYKFCRLERIAFPTNYLIPYNKRELEFLKKMLSPFKPKIEMLYVSKAHKFSIRQEDNQDYFRSVLGTNNLELKQVEKKNVKKSVLGYVENNNINMLVMVNTRHSYLEKILFGSKVGKINLDIKIPMLVLQNQIRAVA